MWEIGCPYISGARATALGKCLKWGATHVVFIDDDMSWEPDDLITLLQTEGDVVAGNYRYKTHDEVRFMGIPLLGPNKRPMVREDGCVDMLAVPAGFLRVSRLAIAQFLVAYPELRLGDEGNVDLFNHGAHNGIWYGEDFAFSRRWHEMGNAIWCPPRLNLVHNGSKGETYGGTYHDYLINYKP